MANSTRFSFTVVSASLLAGLVLSWGCEPRHKNAKTAAATATTTATATTPVTATTTATATATTTAPTTTGTPTTTTTGTPPIGTWPAPTGAGMPGFDPNVLADIAKGMGIPLPAGTPTAASGDPLDAALKASAAKYAPGMTALSPVGRAKLKQGEHAGMNFDMEQGKCYVVLGVGGPGVTQVGLNLLFPAAPPQAIMASDTTHGASPVLGEGKPLCPPIKSSVRVDTVIMAGAGDVAVQVWGK